MSKQKYLVETSAVPVALGQSSHPHVQLFREATAGSDLLKSIFIRKEVIHRWILTSIRIAFEVDHARSVSDALFHLSQSFSIREVKSQEHAVAVLLQSKGMITNARAMATEFARLAIGMLKKYDRLFRSTTRNQSGCRIGGKELSVDFNHMFDDLRGFVDSQKVIEDCPVNDFLGIQGNSVGSAERLLQTESVVKTQAARKCLPLVESKRWITCKECKGIGDVVIALEQPKTVHLLHIDADFEILCSALGRPNKLFPSESAVHKLSLEAERKGRSSDD